MVKKSVVWVLVGLCVLAFAAINVSSVPGEPDGETILQWHSMAAVQTPYFSNSVPYSPIDGVGGGNARWTIEKGWGELKRNGDLRVHTRGLILPDPPFNGQNVVPFFRVLVNCRTTDAAGVAMVVGTFSENYPADTKGDSDLITNITLPSPCYAPTLFVMHYAAPRWFATTGSN